MAKQELTLTSKVRIYPKEEDRQKIIDTADAYRGAANYASKVIEFPSRKPYGLALRMNRRSFFEKICPII